MKNVGVNLRPAAFATGLLIATIFQLSAPRHAVADSHKDVGLGDLSPMLLEPWRETQSSDGRYRRPSGLLVRGPYGNTAIAYAMLMNARRTGDEANFRSAMRGFGAVVRRPINQKGVFTRLFVAAGYNLARGHFAGRPEFLRIRRAWTQRLREARYGDESFSPVYKYNKNIIEAAATMELLRSGVRSRRRGAILANPSRSRAQALSMIRSQVPARVREHTITVGAAEGWPRRVTVADMSDIPDNPPAYNSLVASMFVRAYDLTPQRLRTSQMRNAARVMARGLAARMAPDGDFAFTGRTQELAWSLTSLMHAAWWTAGIAHAADRPILLAAAKRAVERIENAYVHDGTFWLTPSQRCCPKQNKPKGHDVYFDVSNYSGLTAVGLEWALESLPSDWASADGKLPADVNHLYFYPRGRGRFIQFRNANIYWMLRGQGNTADARLDMGVTVMKGRRDDGSWADLVPPHPITGGHHLPADPAGPCLVVGRGRGRQCAYLQLHRGVAVADGLEFSALWRTRRRTIVYSGTAVVRPTERGVRLFWSTRSGQRFQLDHFLPASRCNGTGIAAPGLVVHVLRQTSCRILADRYAGGTHSELDRVRSMVPGTGQDASMDYVSTVGRESPG